MPNPGASATVITGVSLPGRGTASQTPVIPAAPTTSEETEFRDLPEPVRETGSSDFSPSDEETAGSQLSLAGSESGSTVTTQPAGEASHVNTIKVEDCDYVQQMEEDGDVKRTISSAHEGSSFCPLDMGVDMIENMDVDERGEGKGNVKSTTSSAHEGSTFCSLDMGVDLVENMEVEKEDKRTVVRQDSTDSKSSIVNAGPAGKDNPEVLQNSVRISQRGEQEKVEVKDEPVDEEYDKALAPANATSEHVKDEPETTEDNLKISKDFSVGGVSSSNGSHDGAEDDTVGGRKHRNEDYWEKSVQKRRRMMGQPDIGRSKKKEMSNSSLSQSPQELCTSQGGEQLQGLQSDTTDFTFPSPRVKSVEDGERDSLPTNTTRGQIKAESDDEDCNSQCLTAQSLEEEERGGPLPELTSCYPRLLLTRVLNLPIKSRKTQAEDFKPVPRPCSNPDICLRTKTETRPISSSCSGSASDNVSSAEAESKRAEKQLSVRNVTKLLVVGNSGIIQSSDLSVLTSTTSNMAAFIVNVVGTADGVEIRRPGAVGLCDQEFATKEAGSTVPQPGQLTPYRRRGSAEDGPLLEFLREAEAARQSRHEELLNQMKSSQESFQTMMSAFLEKF